MHKKNTSLKFPKCCAHGKNLSPQKVEGFLGGFFYSAGTAGSIPNCIHEILISDRCPSWWMNE